MVIVLYILCAMSFINWINISTKTETVMQQILGSLSFLTASIFLVGGAIVSELQKNKFYGQVSEEQKPDDEKEVKEQKPDESTFNSLNFKNTTWKTKVLVIGVVIILTVLVGLILRAKIEYDMRH
jgi:hypothetical protein